MKKNLYICPQLELIETGSIALLVGSGSATGKDEENYASGTVTDTPGGEFGYGGEQEGEGDAPAFFGMDDF